MATTTESVPANVADEGASAAPAARSRTAGWMLMLVVFVAGGSVMTVEMSASRLLAPYFGTSLFIWANLIGLVMVYLTLGYWLGGRIADRHPSATLLYTLTAIAGFAIGLIPVLSGPILHWSLTGFAQYSVGIFYGSLVGVILLFSIPLLLLGFVSPFAIRLRSLSITSAGGTAGAVSALSTLGSILGTFVPTFLLIPRIGTAATLYSAAIALIVFSMLGLVVARAPKQAGVGSLLLLAALGVAVFAPHGLIKPPPAGRLLTEKESAYNYIQVVQDGDWTELMLNEGHAIHSYYNPNQVLTGGPWDYWLVAPYFAKNFSPPDLKSMAMLGSAGGTAARELTAAYGPVPVDGVEIDPEIIDIGIKYFALGRLTNNTNHIEDARTYLQTDGKDKRWTVIGIDAYRQPYIPFHLTTTEFFSEVRDHLTDDGAAMINAGRTGSDTRLVDALANTMAQVFPSVFVIDVPTMANSMVVGTKSPADLANFAENAARVDNPILKEVLQASLQKGNMREVKPRAGALVFTDDRAPVEDVIDQMILGFVSDVNK